jgi:hypothetical protein
MVETSTTLAWLSAALLVSAAGGWWMLGSRRLIPQRLDARRDLTTKPAASALWLLILSLAVGFGAALLALYGMAFG